MFYLTIHLNINLSYKSTEVSSETQSYIAAEIISEIATEFVINFTINLFQNIVGGFIKDCFGNFSSLFPLKRVRSLKLKFRQQSPKEFCKAFITNRCVLFQMGNIYENFSFSEFLLFFLRFRPKNFENFVILPQESIRILLTQDYVFFEVGVIPKFPKRHVNVLGFEKWIFIIQIQSLRNSFEDFHLKETSIDFQ